MIEPIREVDPGELRLPPSRIGGADLWKLQQQIRRFGSSKDGMPPHFVLEDPDGVLEVTDGVTRATRMAKLAPEKPFRSLWSGDIVGVVPFPQV